MIVEYKRMYHIDPTFIEGRVCVFRSGRSGQEIFTFKQYTLDTLMARIERELPGRNVIFKRLPIVPVEFGFPPVAGTPDTSNTNAGSAG